jgi:YjbR
MGQVCLESPAKPALGLSINMTERTFRRIALALEGAVEAAHMNHPDFRVGGRIFATLKGDGAAAAVKLSPEEQARFVADYPAVFVPESGAWGLQGWTRIQLSPAAEESIGEALTLAWQSALKTPTKPRARRKKRG